VGGLVISRPTFCYLVFFNSSFLLILMFTQIYLQNNKHHVYNLRGVSTKKSIYLQKLNMFIYLKMNVHNGPIYCGLGTCYYDSCLVC
jgi:hypothetical protein